MRRVPAWSSSTAASAIPNARRSCRDSTRTSCPCSRRWRQEAACPARCAGDRMPPSASCSPRQAIRALRERGCPSKAWMPTEGCRGSMSSTRARPAATARWSPRGAESSACRPWGRTSVPRSRRPIRPSGASGSRACSSAVTSAEGRLPGRERSDVKLTGVIQAGGKSVRMGGEPKALMEVGGRRIIERVADVLRQVTSQVLLVTNTPERYAWMGLPMVPDVFPESGSLGGIYSGLKAASGEAVFTVACDMPFLSPAVARLVTSRAHEADVVVPRTGPHYETLHACYARTCLGPMERRLRAGQLKITGFWDEVRVLTIAEEDVARLADPAVVFSNVNTPEELARARVLAAAEARR